MISVKLTSGWLRRYLQETDGVLTISRRTVIAG